MSEPLGESGPWVWDWFDDSPQGETYGVRREGEVLCYTNRYKRGYEDAVAIAAAMNEAALAGSSEQGGAS